MRLSGLAVAFSVLTVSAPAIAQSPRDILTDAAFTPSTKTTALARIEQAVKSADAAISRNPGDQDVRLQRAVAISYRGKVGRNRTDLIAARRLFETAVSSLPKNAEAQMALAGWHLGAVIELGPFVAGTALGASRSKGLAALERSLELSDGRAFFPAFASMVLIQLNPSDTARARRLAERAVKSSTPTSLDEVMQKHAAALLQPLRSGHGRDAAKAAKILLPFGRIR